MHSHVGSAYTLSLIVKDMAKFRLNQTQFMAVRQKRLSATKVVFKCPVAAKSLQSCPTLCDPIEGSPPGSAVPGILQARTLSRLPFPSSMHESEK